MFENMTTQELLERRQALIEQCEGVEERERLEEIEAEANAITEEIEARRAREEERRQAAAAVAAGTGQIIAEARKENTMTNMEVRNSAAYIEAFAHYIKTGKDAECRALLTENVSGDIPVPEFVAGIVSERLKESEILRRCRRMEARGNVKVGFEVSAPAATEHTEGGDPISEEALVLGIVTLLPTTYKKYVSISDEALDSMSGEAYLRYIYEEVARGIFKAEENAVVAAILAAPQTATSTAPAVAKTGTAAGAITDIVEARALLSSAAANLVAIMTPAQYATYRGLQMAANYGVDPFDGLTVLFNDTVTAPIVGDLNGVMINMPKGSSIQYKYDDLTEMDADIVRILGRHPAAIGVVGNLFFAKVAA